MKKVFITVMMICLALLTKAQVKNQFETLKEIGEEKQTITKFRDYIKSSEGKMVAYYSDRFDLRFTKNKFDKSKAFELRRENRDKKGTYITERNNLMPNHYTAPSVFYVECTICKGDEETYGYVFLDGILYKIGARPSQMKAGGDYYIAKTIYTYSEKTKRQGKKKKGGFAAKLKKLKDKIEPKAPANVLVSKDEHKKKIDAYFKAMESVQSKATANLTAQEKKEIQTLLNEKAASKSKGTAANAAWQRKVAADRAKNAGKSDRVTVKNAGNKPIRVYCNNPFEIHPGRTKSFPCSSNIHKQYLDGTMWKKGSLWIKADKKNCGKTINLK